VADTDTPDAARQPEVDLAGIRSGLIGSLQDLRMLTEVQCRFLFPDFCTKADELALDFNNWCGAARGHLPMTQLQRTAIDAVDVLLDAMSRGGPRFDENIWTEDGLRTREEWAEVRIAAARALAAFGVPLAAPPNQPTWHDLPRDASHQDVLDALASDRGSSSEGFAAMVARRAGVALTTRGALTLVAAEDAARFLDACAAEGLRVLGFEGFRLDGQSVVPVMDAIADFSSGPPISAEDSIRDSRRVLELVRHLASFFEFVLVKDAAQRPEPDSRRSR
jgi:hypothetical protein